MIFIESSKNANLINQSDTDKSHVIHLIANQTYCTTHADGIEIRNTLSRLGTESKLLPESDFRGQPGFPVELGVSSDGQQEKTQELLRRVESSLLAYPEEERAKELVKLRREVYGDDPVSISDQLETLGSRSHLRLAFMSPGNGIGDSVVAISAIRLFVQKLLGNFDDVSIDVLLPVISNWNHISIRSLLLKEKWLNQVVSFPITIDQLRQYDAFIDNAGGFRRSYFYEKSIMDGFLYKFGVPEGQVDEEAKRNHIEFMPKDVSRELRKRISNAKKAKPLLLFHPLANSKIRSVPKHKIEDVLNAIKRQFPDYGIVTVNALKNVSGVMDISKLSRSVFDYIYVISKMDAMVTVDTSTYHIADAFDIPTVILGTTFAADIYPRHYPYVGTYMLPGAENTSFYMAHGERDTETARVKKTRVEDEIFRIWDEFNEIELLSAMNKVLKR